MPHITDKNTHLQKADQTMEMQYLDLLRDILENGREIKDRTGVGTIGVFGRTLRCNLQDGFPALTTKKLAWKAVVAELLWFLEGSNNELRLHELTYGIGSDKKTIWYGNMTAPYWKDKAKFHGDVGNIYGVQWRKWKKTDGSGEVDQIANLVDTIKNNPESRRMILSAFNVGDLENMSLPPCHMMAQFNVDVEKGTLNCLMTQRSVDVFLGLPFNIASYALLTMMLAQVTGLKAGELIMSLGDTHIYSNHVEQVKEQLLRQPFKMPTLYLNPSITDIDSFTNSEFTLAGYESHSSISAPMAV